MPIRVRFHFDKITGQVTELLVDDQDRDQSEEHHDQCAMEIGRALVRRPQLQEVSADALPPRLVTPATVGPAEDEDEDEQSVASEPGTHEAGSV